MFNNYTNTLNFFKKTFRKSKPVFKYYKSLKVNSLMLSSNIFIHTGNSLIWRKFSYLFLGRQIKFNVFFKKPLVRPTKKKKK